MNLRALAPCLLLLTLPASPQTAKPAQPAAGSSPVGRWMAEHPSQRGIGSWWEFRANGTFTMHIGAMLSYPITRSGNTITMPSAKQGGPPVIATFRVEGNKLFMKTPDAAETSYEREGPAPSKADPLLGRWRPVPPDAATNPAADNAATKAMMNELVVIAADGTESVRIPFNTRDGTWSAATHTYQFKGDEAANSYERVGPKLNLGQSVDNQQTNRYIPDPIQ